MMFGEECWKCRSIRRPLLRLVFGIHEILTCGFTMFSSYYTV
uniref:Uncharacterized protein n=1 Tax=Pectinaria gouldii TaxID=260746 RepID=Q66SW8_PECGU|nr:hypothetical protein [Pectinaria gouldii]